MSAHGVPKFTPAGRVAGRAIAAMRRSQGHSPETLSFAIFAAGHGSVSGKTIRRIEHGMVPTVRVQFAIASYFDRQVPQLWPDATPAAVLA